jgi:GNAT superfamily N-acetyltransferase
VARTKGKAVLLSCHYDVLDWLEPDWIFDTATGAFERAEAGRRLRRRPRIELEIRQVDGSYWPLFEPHHYLKLPRMVACRYFVGFVDGEPVIHLGVAPRLEVGGVRACRMVVMPEWQGAGVGTRFLNWIMENEVTGHGQFGDRVRAGTSTPATRACAPRSAATRSGSRSAPSCTAGSKRKSFQSIKGSHDRLQRKGRKVIIPSPTAGYGGHFRAVQGFRYRGEAWAARKLEEAQKRASAGN